MVGWKKKEEEGKEAETKEEGTPLQKKKVIKEEELNEAQQEYNTMEHEITYRMNNGMEWASNLSGAIRRALEDRTPLVVTERDLDALEFYTIVLSHMNPGVLVKAFMELEREERAKVENDVSVS